MSEEVSQLNVAPDRFVVNLNIRYRFPLRGFPLNFFIFKAFQLQELLGFDAPGAVRQGVDHCFEGFRLL